MPMIRYLSKHFSKGEVIAVMCLKFGSEYMELFKEWYQTPKEQEDPQKKEERRQMRELFTNLYMTKAQELSGKKTAPRFTAKENSLLLQDHNHYGPELETLMYLFFSDKVEEVSAFTRYKQKAGYSYPVFHGMLEKLAISDKKPEKPCRHCGKIGAHDPRCPVVVARKARLEQEREEIEAAKEKYEGPSLAELFKEKKRRQ